MKLYFKELPFLSFIFVLLFIIQVPLQVQKMAEKSLEAMHAIRRFYCFLQNKTKQQNTLKYF